MSIFSQETFEQVTDQYLEEHAVISRYISTGDAYRIWFRDRNYMDCSDYFWHVYRRAEGYIKSGIHDLHNRSASHLKVAKHINQYDINILKKMFMKHLDECGHILIYKGRHYHSFNTEDDREDALYSFVVPMARYICKLWPFCKYPIIFNHFGEFIEKTK